MAQGGCSHDVRLLSYETCELAQSNPHEDYDAILKCKTKFTAGGWHVFDSKLGFDRQGSLGWIGMGGSCLQWHTQQRVGFGYTCNLFGLSLNNVNSARVQNEVIECARRLSSSMSVKKQKDEK